MNVFLNDLPQFSRKIWAGGSDHGVKCFGLWYLEGQGWRSGCFLKRLWIFTLYIILCYGSAQEADFKLPVISFQQQRLLWLPRVWYVFWRRQKERKSFHFEKHNALASSLSWQRSCIGVSSLKGDQIAHHRQLRWITLPVFAKRLLTAPHPIPAPCNTWCIGVYLVFTSYYCHSAKLILESKGFFVKRRLQQPEYKSALLILAAGMNTTLDKSLLWTEQGTRLAGAGLSSGTSLLG